MSSTPFYGGQAVIEGVMMRGPHHMAVGVRDPSGRIVVHAEALDSSLYRSRWARWPFIRGAITLWDAMALGMRSISFAASVALGGESEDSAIAESQDGLSAPIWGSMILAVVLAAGVFFVLPVVITNAADRYIGSPLLSNVVEKVIRLGLILGYILAIGQMADVKRVFRYHGAEHKTINAYEAGVELTPPNVRPFTLLHPRCGTTFLLIVVIISFVVFAFLGRPPLLERIVSRIVLLPVIAGIAFEVIRLGASNYHRAFVRAILAPGLAVQRLTTSEPDDSMLEVAIAALKRVLADEGVAAEGVRSEESGVRSQETGVRSETPA
jgi:uncharacterized protein YqhQ